MMELRAVLYRGPSILVILMAAAIWHWVTARRLSRGRTFFGVRVQAGFADSGTGQAILEEFRWRLWSWALASAAVSTLLPFDLGLLAGGVLCSSAAMVALALAHGRARREATAAEEPAVRVAWLAADDEPGALWPGVVDWLLMLVPVAAPVATLLFLILHRAEAAAGYARAPRVYPVVLFLTTGLACAANQWALRFRARSSDWAPTRRESRRYRTYLGSMMSLFFAFIGSQTCVLALMHFKDEVAWLRHLEPWTDYRVLFPAQMVMLVYLFGMRFWLTKHLATASGDPMPDNCWKWGLFYFNPGDPAIVVPARAGIGESFNYAHPSVWVVEGAAIVLSIAGLVPSIAGLELMRL